MIDTTTQAAPAVNGAWAPSAADFDAEELTLAEVDQIEKQLGHSIGSVLGDPQASGRTRVLAAIASTIRSRHDTTWTLDRVLAETKLRDLNAYAEAAVAARSAADPTAGDSGEPLSPSPTPTT